MINAPHHIDITAAIIEIGDPAHCHREVITKIDGHEIGTCAGCGRVLDYTVLQDQVPILQSITYTRKGVNLTRVVASRTGTQKKIRIE